MDYYFLQNYSFSGLYATLHRDKNYHTHPDAPRRCLLPYRTIFLDSSLLILDPSLALPPPHRTLRECAGVKKNFTLEGCIYQWEFIILRCKTDRGLRDRSVGKITSPWQFGCLLAARSDGNGPSSLGAVKHLKPNIDCIPFAIFFDFQY